MSSASAVKRSLQGLEEGLTAFTTQLAQETAELRRNVENRPTTGATFYSRILMDLAERLDGVDEELFALERLSLDAVSLEELVGHSVALYRHNHHQIQQLETTLAQYGYRDLYAPLPPDNPLDMLELSAAGASQAGMPAASEPADAEGEDAQRSAPQGDAGGEEGAQALGELTNRLTAAELGPTWDASPPRPGVQAAWGVQGGGGVPRTTLKALAPMTAGRVLLARSDTPSSIASPDAMSPSMRELLGKYAASSGGGTQQQALSAAPPSAAATPRGPGSRAGGTPPLPAYLSPAFQLAAMEQEVQMAHAAAAGPPEAAQQAATPPPSSSWPADDALREALTATARKLQGAPSFLEAYRQRFPAIVASTERLLQTVEKQRRPTAAAAVAQEEAAGGPVAALAMAAQQAAGTAAPRPHPAEESTIDLMAQVLGRAAGQPLGGGDGTGDAGGGLEAAAACSTRFHGEAAAGGGAAFPHAAAAPQRQQAAPPDTAVLLSRAVGGTAGAAPAAVTGAAHPIGSLLEDDDGQPAACDDEVAAPPLQSAPRSQRSKPQLEEAIAAALGRGRAAPAPAAAADGGIHAAAGPPAPTPAPPAPPACRGLAQAPPPPSSTRPPPPPAADARDAALAHVATEAVPALRLVGADEYAALPTFIKSQLPLELLNGTLERVHAAAAGRGSGFTMQDVEEAGLGAKCKVVVNSLVKLGRAQLKVLPGSGTLYLLV